MKISKYVLQKIIKEEISKQLLCEVKYKDALENIYKKPIRNILIQFLNAVMDDPSKDVEKNIDFYMKKIEKDIKSLIPRDLTDSKQGATTLWLLKQLKNAGYDAWEATMVKHSQRRHFYNIIETFWMWQQFMSEKQLNNLDIGDLARVVSDAKGQIEAYQLSRQNKGWEKGTDVLSKEGSPWWIAAIHTKGAACHWGARTTLCTAAGGDRNYFDTYYSKESPLFLFRDLTNSPDRKTQNAADVYQFSYKSSMGAEFEDGNKRTIEGDEFFKLHRMLKATGASSKYPIIEVRDIKDATNTPNIPSEAYDRWLNHENAEMRKHLAATYGVPPDVLMKLVNDPDSEVRQYLVYNRILPLEGLVQLSQDKDNDVQYNVAKKFDSDIRELYDENPEFAKQIWQNLMNSNDEAIEQIVSGYKKALDFWDRSIERGVMR